MSLHCYGNGTDIVIAESPEDAKAVMVDETACNLEEIEEFEIMPDEKVIKISCEDAPEGEEIQSRTAAEWVAENGRGFLASTENY